MKANGVVGAVVGHHRQHRAEQLLLQHLHVRRRPGDDVQRQLPVAGRRLRRAGGDGGALGARVGQHRLDALELPVADDAGEVGVALGVAAVELLEAALDRRHERIDALARHQRVVRRDADLPAVDRLAVRDAQRRVGHRVVARDHRRRLAAEFQRHRGQVLRRGAHDDLADRRRAGEDDVVEGQRGEDVRVDQFLADHRHQVFAEDLAEQRLEHRVGRRRHLRHLDHHAVACGQRGDQRAHRQVDREVPRHDHADHALGLVQDLHAVAEEQQLGRALAGFHPALQVRDRVVGFEHRTQQVQHLRFGRGAEAEVGAHRFGQQVLVALRLALQRAQPLEPLVGARVGLRQTGGALRGVQPLHPFHRLQRLLRLACAVVHVRLLVQRFAPSSVAAVTLRSAARRR